MVDYLSIVFVPKVTEEDYLKQYLIHLSMLGAHMQAMSRMSKARKVKVEALSYAAIKLQEKPGRFRLAAKPWTKESISSQDSAIQGKGLLMRKAPKGTLPALHENPN